MDEKDIAVGFVELEVKQEQFNSITFSISSNGNVGQALIDVIKAIKSLE